MSEYSNSPASVKHFVGNPIPAWKKAHPEEMKAIGDPGPAVPLTKFHSPNDLASHFLLDHLKAFNPNGSREDRLAARIPAQIFDFLKSLHYDSAINKKYSTARLGRFAQHIGTGTLLQHEDVIAILTIREELWHDFKKPTVRRSEYRPFNTARGPLFRLNQFGPDLQEQVFSTADLLGLAVSAWISATMLSGLARAPIGRKAQRAIKDELTVFGKMLRIEREILEQIVSRKRRKRQRSLSKGLDQP